jgi:hypothetical protein
LVAVALALGGCMRIYPDPELPDILVEWFAELDCSEDGDRVVVSLSAVDPAAEVGMVAVPCRDGGVRFDDVARARYHLAAHLEDTAGAPLGGYDTDIDLRDGLNERVSTFFGRAGGSNFRVAWTFDMGASCAALSVTFMVLQASIPDGEPLFSWNAPCEAPVFVDVIPIPGTFTLSARAIAADAVVATSPESAPFAVASGAIIDFGTLTLSPCGTACPQLAPSRR